LKQSKNDEFENFDRTMRKLIAVPRADIKAKLDAEKAEKAIVRKTRKKESDGNEQSNSNRNKLG
jgi:hypothetical protein